MNAKTDVVIQVRDLTMAFGSFVVQHDVGFGILGGLLIGVSSMGLTLTEYWNETVQAVDFFDITLGLLKALIFGIVIAVTGCMYGMQSGRSASSVGNAATSAVVTSIVMIVVIDGIFAVITSLLGI